MNHNLFTRVAGPVISAGLVAIAACPAEADPAKKQQQILYGSVGGGATAIFYPENLFFGIRGETAPFLRLADIETDDGRAQGAGREGGDRVGLHVH